MDKIYIYMLEESVLWEGENVFGILYSLIFYTEDEMTELIRDINEKIDEFDNKQTLRELEKYKIYPVSPIVIDGYLTGVDLPDTFGGDAYINLDKLKEANNEI